MDHELLVCPDMFMIQHCTDVCAYDISEAVGSAEQAVTPTRWESQRYNS